MNKFYKLQRILLANVRYLLDYINISNSESMLSKIGGKT